MSGFCPFLKPSLERGLLKFTHIRIQSPEDPERIFEAVLFWAGLFCAEMMRVRRMTYPDAADRILYSETVVIDLDERIAIDGAQVFGWPHWMLKKAYAHKGIVFGKFWKGEEDRTQDGTLITPPESHFLSIRSAVKSRDGRFFNKAPDLQQLMLSSDDDGSELVLPKTSSKSLKSQLEKFRERGDCQFFQDVLEELVLSGLYFELKQRAVLEYNAEQ